MNAEISNLILKVVTVIVDNYLFDIEKLSQPWMYYLIFVPAIAYVIFFLFKWTILTCPIWLPCSIIAAIALGSNGSDGSDAKQSSARKKIVVRDN